MEFLLFGDEALGGEILLGQFNFQTQTIDVYFFTINFKDELALRFEIHPPSPYRQTLKIEGIVFSTTHSYGFSEIFSQFCYTSFIWVKIPELSFLSIKQGGFILDVAMTEVPTNNDLSFAFYDQVSTFTVSSEGGNFSKAKSIGKIKTPLDQEITVEAEISGIWTYFYLKRGADTFDEIIKLRSEIRDKFGILRTRTDLIRLEMKKELNFTGDNLKFAVMTCFILQSDLELSLFVIPFNQLDQSDGIGRIQSPITSSKCTLGPQYDGKKEIIEIFDSPMGQKIFVYLSLKEKDDVKNLIFSTQQNRRIEAVPFEVRILRKDAVFRECKLFPSF